MKHKSFGVFDWSIFIVSSIVINNCIDSVGNRFVAAITFGAVYGFLKFLVESKEKSD